MGIPMIAGSAQAYARGVYTQAKAMLRVEKGLTPTEEKQARDKSLIESMLDPDRGKTMNVVSIQSKLDRGQKLTVKEMDWLRRNKPDLYKKAKEVQAEREQFERELKRCKTKEDVQRLRMQYSQKICNEMETAMKNGGDATTAKWKFLAVDDTHLQFTRTSEYKEMPTELELRMEKEKEQKKKETRKKTAKKDTLMLQMLENQKPFGPDILESRNEETGNIKKAGDAEDKEGAHAKPGRSTAETAVQTASAATDENASFIEASGFSPTASPPQAAAFLSRA